MYAYKGVKIASFSENFVYVTSEWLPANIIQTSEINIVKK